MKTNFLITEAFQALRSNLLRSLLTIIGIVVGIFSVTAMLALGAGLSANVLDRFSAFAQGDLTISGDLTAADLAWIKTKPYVTNGFGTRTVQGAKVIAFGSDFSPAVELVVGDYEKVAKFTVTEGTAFDFTDPSYNEHVAVVSTGFADKVSTDTGRAVLNQTVTINNIPYTIIGVVESSSPQFTRGDGVLFVPYGVGAGELTSSKTFASVAVLLQDSSYYDIAGQDILSSLNAAHELAADSDKLFTVETAQAFIQSAEETTSMISLFLGIVGSIALFVGGIGTMNMMLTTVTERTKEIGLRKAIGARDRDILLQILIESVILTSLGGAIGILLSLGVAQVANQVFANSNVIKVLVNVQVVLLAAGVSLLVGVVFGIYPARNAARLQPVDALRSE